MLEGLSYDEVDGLDFLEPKLNILEDFYDYLKNNGYENILPAHFSVSGIKDGRTIQLFYDAAKYFHYILRVADTYNLFFRYEDGKYFLYQMDTEKEFSNLKEIIDYFNTVSTVTV